MTMAELSKAQLESIVSRVTEQFAQELSTNPGRGLAVTELGTQAVELNKIGGDATWTISYSTAAAALAGTEAAARAGVDAAWTISYSTAAAAELGVEEVAARGGR
jgi:hypothetical protein